MKDDTESTSLKYRREKFACKVEPADFPEAPGEITLKVTQNGYQWAHLTLLPEEAEKVAALLQANTQGQRRRASDAAEVADDSRRSL